MRRSARSAGNPSRQPRRNQSTTTRLSERFVGDARYSFPGGGRVVTSTSSHRGDVHVHPCGGKPDTTKTSRRVGDRKAATASSRPHHVRSDALRSLRGRGLHRLTRKMRVTRRDVDPHSKPTVCTVHYHFHPLVETQAKTLECARPWSGSTLSIGWRNRSATCAKVRQSPSTSARKGT